MKKVKALFEKLSFNGNKETREQDGREYLAEQLEGRVLYSGTVAPDASVDDQPVQEAPADYEPEGVGADGSPVSAIEAAQQASAEMEQFVSEGIELAGGETDIAEDQGVVILNPEVFGNLGQSGGLGSISQEVAQAVSDAAAERWSASGVLTEDQGEALGDVSVQVADLEGDLLVLVSDDNSTILLDIDAAGRAWFVDGTPLDDSEFTDRVSLNGFRAESGTATEGVDVMTILMEAQGALLGVDGVSAAREVSATGLEEGLRRIPIADEALTNPDEVTTSLVIDLAQSAAQRWEDSGLSGAQLEALADIEYRVVDLASGILGSTENGVVSIDLNGAGKGWFVDLSPEEDSEFGVQNNATSLSASEGAAAEGVDLLSVILHEQGHILGLDHVAESSPVTVMTDEFSEGDRRLIEESEANGAIVGSLEGAHYATTIGQNTSALVGGDLTDLDNTSDENAYNGTTDLGGFDAQFFSSDESFFEGNEGSFNVFDNKVGGGSDKSCCGTAFPQIVGADFSDTLATGDTRIHLTRFTLTSSNDSPQRDPQNWEIQGSNNTTTGLDGTWVTIFDHPSGNDWSARNQVISYSAADGDTFLTSEGFTAFRMVTYETGATSGAFYALNEIEFFGFAAVNDGGYTATEDAILEIPDGATDLLANDIGSSFTTGSPSLVAVDGEASSVGASIDLAAGGKVTVGTEGNFTFDPDGDFEWLSAGETADVSFDYSISSDRAGFNVNTNTGEDGIVLGTGTGALLGGDLTDPENDGAPDADTNYNAVFSSSSLPGFGNRQLAFNVFDNQVGNSNEKTCCNGPTQFIAAEFDTAYVLTHFTITSSGDSPQRDPDIWAIQGSNDGVNWSTIYDYTADANPFTDRNQVLLYTSSAGRTDLSGGTVHFETTDSYTDFRYLVTSTGGNQHALNELEFFGVPEESDTAEVSIEVTGVNDAPEANSDTNVIIETGGADTGENATVSGNVLVGGANPGDVADTDVDNADNAGINGSDLTVDNAVVSVIDIAYTGGGMPFQTTNPGGAVTGPSQVDGQFGTLTINPDGSYSYALDDDAVDGLNTGDVEVEEFTYTIADGSRYVQNFNGFADGTADLGDGTLIEDQRITASVQGGALMLADNEQVENLGSGDSRGIFRIPGLEGSSLGWTASFTAIFDDLGDNDQPADGFSFSYGDIPGSFGTNVGDENGWGSGDNHIAYEFNTNSNAYRISVNRADVVSQGATPAILPSGGSRTMAVSLVWDPIDGATLTVDGTDIFTNQSVGAFTGDDAHTFAFASRTFGRDFGLKIDNLEIVSAEPTATATATLTINITGTNDAPIAVDDAASTDEDTVFTSSVDLLDTASGAPTVLANDTDVDLAPVVDFTDFSDISSLILNGDATQSGSSLRVAPAANSQAGSAYLNDTLYFDGETSFSTAFEFELTGGSGDNGADGLAFVLQTQGINALGVNGGGLGYQNIAPSVAVVFDTHNETGFNLGIRTNGNGGNNIAGTANGSPIDFNDPATDVVSAWVEYDASTNLLEVFVTADGTKPATATLSATVDIPQVLGGGFADVYVGFTAATGGATNNHDVLNWSFAKTDAVKVVAAQGTALSSGVVTVASTEGASVTMRADGSFDYDPRGVAALQGLALGESVNDTFTYTIVDESGVQDTAEVTVTVSGVNDEPENVVVDATDIDEPGTTTLTVNFDDADLSDIHTVMVDWLDGSGNVVASDSQTGDGGSGGTGVARSFTFNRAFADDDPTSTPSDDYSARVTINDISIQKNNFSDLSDFALNGDAAQVGAVLRLAPNVGNQAGSAYHTTPFDASALESFISEFDVQFGGGDSGADGLVFMIQKAGLTAIGNSGNDVGYSGITPSVGVHLDTYTENQSLDILVNGSLGPVATTTNVLDFNDPAEANIVNVKVVYNAATTTLDVYLAADGAAFPVTPTLSHVIDLGATLGAGDSYFGFSAGTGGATNNHDVVNWTLRSSESSHDATFTVSNVAPTVSTPVSAAATEDDSTFTVDLLDGASDASSLDTLNVANLSLSSGDASGVTGSGNELTVDPSAYNSLAAGDSEVIAYNYDVVDDDTGSVVQTATITITGVNDAPVLGAPVNNFNDVGISQLDNDGDRVSYLLNGQGSDVDNDTADAEVGIAVTGAEITDIGTGTGTGVFQYQLEADAGTTTWTTFTPTVGDSLLLRPEDRVRFLPDGANVQSGTITFRAWDQTTGSAGSTADTGTNGGTTPFSADFRTSSVAIAELIKDGTEIVYAPANGEVNTLSVTFDSVTNELVFTDTTSAIQSGFDGGGTREVRIGYTSGEDLTIETGDENDIVTIDLTDSGFSGNLTVNGEDGLDKIIYKSNGVVLAAGSDAAFTAEEIVFGPRSGLETTDGDITITSEDPDNLGAGLNYQGVTVLASSLSAGGDGIITITGQGGGVGSNNEGIQISKSSSLTAADGDIILVGTGGGDAGSYHNDGVTLLSASSVVITGSGSVDITGTGGLGLRFAQGIEMNGSSITVGTGDITLAGTANGTDFGNRGVVLTNGSLESGGGNLSVTGTAGAGSSGEGIEISATDLSTTGAGTVTLTGAGATGSGTNSSGILIAKGSEISSADGAISIEGTGNGTGSGNHGVTIVSGASISATGAGTLTLTGVGAAATSKSSGVVINNANLSVVDGLMTVTGTGNAATYSRGIELQRNTSLSSTGSGGVTLEGTGGGSATGRYNTGIYSSRADITLTGSGNLSLTGTAGMGNRLNEGVRIVGGSLLTASGTMSITGDASNATSGTSNAGVYILGATLNPGGALSLEGIGGGGSRGYGVFMHRILGITESDITTLVAEAGDDTDDDDATFGNFFA